MISESQVRAEGSPADLCPPGPDGSKRLLRRGCGLVWETKHPFRLAGL